MNFKKVNNLTGWVVFLISLATYMLTREARGSLWDCGEFVAAADKVQLPHPPGAPFFILLGRLFIVLFGDQGSTAANAVNFMSALASAATILFLFWTITHFARKMFVKAGENLTSDQIVTVMAAGVIGALAYNFSDSFWFSAVEGEVYALSSFFTALVFWSMLKWEHADEHAGNDEEERIRSDRWIIFLFFMMGLSIGVHLLNLLTIPAIVMIYYYRRYRPTVRGSIIAFIVGCLITGIVQVAIIQYSMKAAGLFDVLFVNSFGMPFFSGFALYFIAVAAVILFGLRLKANGLTRAKTITFFVLFLALSTLPFFVVPGGGGGSAIAKFLLVAGIGVIAGYFIKASALKVLKLSLWCYAFMMLGYFMYFTALIRSNANPAIDMNNVDNPINLVYYLSREQYGSAPLVYGPHFAAEPDKIVEGEMKYVRDADKYTQIGRTFEYGYPSSDKQLFPRIWDSSDDQRHATFYAQWLGLGYDQQSRKFEAPSYRQNIEWFFTYQMDLMYWRYFLWNFAGKQNDIQGLGNVRDGNWITGFDFIDNKRLGDQAQLPDSIKENKANNRLYMLPFILGIVGCVYQFLKNRRDWIVSFLLFFFTGIAVVLYLNQPGNQPRERDYAYVGSFFAFAIWIGLAVVAFVRLAREKADKAALQNVLIYGGATTFVLMVFSSLRVPPSNIATVAFLITALFAVVTLGITFVVRAVSSGGKNNMALNASAGLICLLVPVLMAQQEWDDHDRHQKTLAPDLARDYLESCAPNAIIFTFGDNDTYPLWYAQEVENIRPDVRIINNSLLGIDWYIDQLRYKINDAAPVKLGWGPEKTRGNKRNYAVFSAKGDQSKVYNLLEVMDYLGSDDPAKMDHGRGEPVNMFPVTKVFVRADREQLLKTKTVNENDSVVSPMVFELPQRTLFKNDLVMLNIIANNNWERPIYFTTAVNDLGFGAYFRKDGLANRLVPIMAGNPAGNWTLETEIRNIEQEMRVGIGGSQIRANNSDTMYHNLINKYLFGGANKKGVYFDEENRRHLLNIRSVFAEAAGNLADAGRKDEATKLLDKVEAGIDPSNLPYAMVSRFNSHNQTGLMYLEAAYKAGRKDLAEKIRQGVRKDLEDQQRYYKHLELEQPEFYGASLEGTEVFLNNVMLRVLDAIERRYAPETQKVRTAIEGASTITTPKDTTGQDTIR